LRVTGSRQVVYLYTTLASKTMVDPEISKKDKQTDGESEKPDERDEDRQE